MLRVNGVLILVVLHLLLQAQPQLAQIRGEVVDARTGRPLSQARVRIRHVPVSVLSDSIGHFRLGNVPLGLVEFQVEKEGYEPYLSSVNMGAKVYLINVRLQAKATTVHHHTVPQGIEQYQERVYLHTDKPYYYPGEIIWMKAYVQYVDTNKRDSLSRTLYIDLVDAKQKMVKSLLLSVDSGRWRGSLVLPQELAPGSYALRGYTRFMLNFNDPSRIFTKLVPVLARNQRIDIRSAQALPEAVGTCTVSTEPAEIRTRTKVILRIRSDSLPGNCSVAIVDAAQVVPIPETAIGHEFSQPWRQVSEFYPRYIVDKGVCFYGTVRSETGRAIKSGMTIFRRDFADVLDFVTDEAGYFVINGLRFYDSATWYYQSKSKKGKASFGTINIDPWIPPPIGIVPGFWFRVENTDFVQRILPDYLLPLDARILDEVVVRQSRLQDERKIPGLLGGADQVVDVEKLPNLGNLLLALQGKVVGLNISCQGIDCQVYFSRAVGTTLVGSIDPLVLINNAPVSGSAGEILSRLDINQVERIEFSRRINVLYGEQGRNGIISVYLKSGAVIGERDTGIRSFQLPGFHRPLDFRSPDYADSTFESTGADYRSTLYWNPEVVPDSTGTISLVFTTSDLDGPYRITLEGLTKSGKPVRLVKYIQVTGR